MTRREPVDREGRTFQQYVTDQVRDAVMADDRTVREIAADAGMNHMTLYRRLNEQPPFKLFELALLAQALGIHPGQLIAADGFVPVDPDT